MAQGVWKLRCAGKRNYSSIPDNLDCFQIYFVGRSMSWDWNPPLLKIHGKSLRLHEFVSWMLTAHVWLLFVWMAGPVAGVFVFGGLGNPVWIEPGSGGVEGVVGGGDGLLGVVDEAVDEAAGGVGAAGSIEGGRQELGATLGQALRGLAQQRRPDVPLIGLAHLNIAGSKVGGGEVLIGQEIELSPADLDEIGCDYWALGHIHAPQQIAERAWYAGTPQPHSFGDSNVNGFNLVEIEGPGKPPRVTFVETPAVKLVTDHVLWANGAWVHNTDDCALAGQPVGRVHLRVVATVDEADRDAARWGDLDRWGHAFAPLSVKIERRIIPTTRVRSEAIRAASSVPEKLAAFWDTQTPSPPADERERAVELLEVIA